MNKVELFLKELSRNLWQDELSELDEFRQSELASEILYTKTLNELNILIEKYKDLELDNSNLYDLIYQNNFSNNEKWPSYICKYKTIDGLEVEPNTFITINDREIKKALISNNFHKLSFEDVIWKLEEWIYGYIKYTPDNSSFDDWRSASYTFKNKKGDCDNKAILFQTCMHILGYGDKCVVIVNDVDFETFKGGHAYNKVLLNDKWEIVDPTNPRIYRKESWKYDVVHPQLNWFFNYYGTYKLSNDKVLGIGDN